MLDLLSARVIDLAQSYWAGHPHWPTHPPFARTLTKLHGESVLRNGASSAADSISLGTHTGTHIDALCHFSCGGKVYGGEEVSGRQSYTGGVEVHGIEQVGPIVRRGVLLDLAPGCICAPDFVVTREHLRQVEARPGDVVLLRTGWGRYWDRPAEFLNGMRTPGAPGGRSLVQRAGRVCSGQRHSRV